MPGYAGQQMEISKATSFLQDTFPSYRLTNDIEAFKIIGHAFSESRLRDFWKWFYSRLTYLDYCH